MENNYEILVPEYFELILKIIKDINGLDDKLFIDFFDTMPIELKEDIKSATFENNFSQFYSSKEGTIGFFKKKANKFKYDIFVSFGNIEIYREKNNQKQRYPIYEKMSCFIKNLDNLLKDKAENTLIFKFAAGFEAHGVEKEPFTTTVNLIDNQTKLFIQTNMMNRRKYCILPLNEEFISDLIGIKNGFAEKENSINELVK